MKDTLNPKWQKRRLEILTRDNFTCQICGDSENTLHVHHLHYDRERRYWEYADHELITLCEDCHHIEHSINTYEMLAELKQQGITNLEIASVLETVLVGLREVGNHHAIINLLGGETGTSFTGAENELLRLAQRRANINNK